MSGMQKTEIRVPGLVQMRASGNPWLIKEGRICFFKCSDIMFVWMMVMNRTSVHPTRRNVCFQMEWMLPNGPNVIYNVYGQWVCGTHFIPYGVYHKSEALCKLSRVQWVFSSDILDYWQWHIEAWGKKKNVSPYIHLSKHPFTFWIKKKNIMTTL